MKVLMLGWEYPPHIAGGLGTACAGLTTALAAQGVSIHFVVPQMFGDEDAGHMRLSSAGEHGEYHTPGAGTIERTGISSSLLPYCTQDTFEQARAERTATSVTAQKGSGTLSRRSPRYSVVSSLFTEVEQFAADVVARFSGVECDLIHAHDWMTFPAGMALAQSIQRPLVVHVHSLEHDRSGVFYDKSINALERFGMRSAARVIAVSHYTKHAIRRYHEIAEEKISVVHNGTYPRQVKSDYRQLKTWPKHVVLFLGRVTFQKGPESFVEVAKRVIPHVPDVLFVVAGDGDLLPKVREKVAELNLKDHFLFPGFVQGEELEELFSVADLYVMPSVSEPFGIAALEAISYDTPVLLSKQSGVSEVIQHALKVDFWDTAGMADRIINALKYEELQHELVEHARREVAQLHWGAAAAKTCDVYQEVIAGQAQQMHDSCGEQA